MSGPADFLRTLRDKALTGPLARSSDVTAERVSGELRAELDEIRRILSDQALAAADTAEVLGRAVSRLTADVEDLLLRLEKLRPTGE
ncbi:MAG: hypothetical protein ACRDYC_13935 [Acidimicrobiales bacterium]